MIARAAAALACALTLAAGAAASPRHARLGEAERALGSGDAEQATRLYDRAASLEHASDVELGLVRSHMQAGSYRRALAFAAHTAGAHGDDVGGSVLYAWLLSLGGQRAFAQRVLDTAEVRQPGAPLLAEARRLLALPLPVPTEALLATPHRVAPYASGSVAPEGSRTVASGWLIDAGRRALVPAAAVDTQQPLWLRNGLGHTAEARFEHHIEPLGLSVWRLVSPIETGASPTLAERDAFPGAPAYTLQFTHQTTATPTWPWLLQGFLGMPVAGSDLRKLGIDAHGGGGGPVFDLAGRLICVSLPAINAAARLVPASALRAQLGAWLPVATAASAGINTTARRQADEIYENALPFTLQVMQTPLP